MWKSCPTKNHQVDHLKLAAHFFLFLPFSTVISLYFSGLGGSLTQSQGMLSPLAQNVIILNFLNVG